MAAQSAPIEIGAGASATRDNETTLALTAAWLPEWRRTEHGVLRWDVGAIYVRGRDDTRLNLDEDVGVFHGGARYERDNGFVAGFGAGVQVGRTDALSGNPQFVSSIGWRWQRFSLMARHISNASIKQPNDGETMLVATWRLR
ncbi:acyloxyacyl hydrolase [Luteimonas chenhongjianii]|uniref:acyloxyacyl hydrolase n=1 Tax=Luteimonas chenhongjianii TaxID=2006110 RepID=UPI001FE3BC3F|nr:acyloxyacyl hydrolase [Luteimonas chenhongjianii]